MLQDLSFNSMLKVRQSHRQQDMAESQALLLELGTSEPTLQQCFKIIESTCLSQGIFCRIKGEECTKKFQNHIDAFYSPFLKDALRAMFMYGFVPWRVRKLRSGDNVPEVLPPGTFTWFTEVGPEQDVRHYTNGKKRRLPRYHDDDSRLVVYRVLPTVGGLKEEDVNVYMTSNPALNVSENSILSATVSSPLAHILTDYKNLRNAQIRKSYADAWNTTAHIISTFRPNMKGQDDPTQYLMDFVHESHFAQPAMGNPIFPSLEAHNYFERDMLIRRQLDRPSTHRPQVYTLPRDHDVSKQIMLQPCEDLGFLMDKFRRDITALTGVPHEMIVGQNFASHETVRKTLASGRIFSTNMHEICRHCQHLLSGVYSHIYNVKKEDVEFFLTPMPRLEIESIADFKTLFEIGAITPEMSLELSKMLLGNVARLKNGKQDWSKEGDSTHPGLFGRGSNPTRPNPGGAGDTGAGSGAGDTVLNPQKRK